MLLPGSGATGNVTGVTALMPVFKDAIIYSPYGPRSWEGVCWVLDHTARYGCEFIAKEARGWINAVGTRASYSKRGNPAKNGHCEISCTLRQAQMAIESWRQHYDTMRPHSSLGYKPLAPEVVL
jgi:transposase InsO family protein